MSHLTRKPVVKNLSLTKSAVLVQINLELKQNLKRLTGQTPDRDQKRFGPWRFRRCPNESFWNLSAFDEKANGIVNFKLSAMFKFKRKQDRLGAQKL